ncbi:hypothetical protein [Desulfoluna sp.]|uniref:hypothetical protein n=1 Tax=Desulfoluna sp. TaxID=2045199 RepID=UPI002633334E|nr:hypothetical protein [Desulfoluna sp.]
MTIAITLIGLIIFVVGGIHLLIEAFGQSIFWGLGCFFINPVCIVFILCFWGVAKKPFFTQLVGFVLILIGLNLHG